VHGLEYISASESLHFGTCRKRFRATVIHIELRATQANGCRQIPGDYDKCESVGEVIEMLAGGQYPMNLFAVKNSDGCSVPRILFTI